MPQTAYFLHCSSSATWQEISIRLTLSVSGRGLITIPSQLRQAAGIRPKDHLIAETTPDGLLLRPAVTLPIEHYTAERIAEFDREEAKLAQWYSKKS